MTHKNNMHSQDTWDTMIEDCLSRLQHGETIEACLRRYSPEHQDELASFLRPVARLSEPRRAPSDAADARMRAKLLVAYHENEQIEKSAKSVRKNERNQRDTRYEQRRKHAFFTRFSGALVGLAVIAFVSMYIITNFISNQGQERTAMTPRPTTAPFATTMPMPTDVPLTLTTMATNAPMPPNEPLATKSPFPTEYTKEIMNGEL